MIVGGMVGALHGIGTHKGVPQEMWDKVRQCDTSSSSYPRPSWLEPRYISILINEVIRMAPVSSS